VPSRPIATCNTTGPWASAPSLPSDMPDLPIAAPAPARTLQSGEPAPPACCQAGVDVGEASTPATFAGLTLTTTGRATGAEVLMLSGTAVRCGRGATGSMCSSGAGAEENLMADASAEGHRETDVVRCYAQRG
jgi:hypothetical protein